MVLLGLVALVSGVVSGAYFAYSNATRASGSVYSRVATKGCLERKGFSVRPSRVPDEPEHRDLYVHRPPPKQGTYPTLLFFSKRSEAREYAQGDSAPLLRRGNVVVGVEDTNGDAESVPNVRVLVVCLRTAAGKDD